MGSDIKVDNKGEVCKSIGRGTHRNNKGVNSIDTRWYIIRKRGWWR